MAQNDKIQLFEDKRIRTAWDEEKEEWYFSVVDVVAVLTDSVDPAASGWGHIRPSPQSRRDVQSPGPKAPVQRKRPDVLPYQGVLTPNNPVMWA